MKVSSSFILAAMVFPATSAVGGILNTLLNPLIQRVATAACAAGQKSLKIDSTTNCDCKGNFALGSGIKVDVACTLKQPQCIQPPDLYCAQGTVKANLAAGLFSGASGISSDVSACFDVKSGFPSGVGSLDNICITAKPKGFKLDTCKVTIGTEVCDKCTICSSGADFKFNCSNVDIGGALLVKIPGPSVANCIGLSLITTNVSSRV